MLELKYVTLLLLCYYQRTFIQLNTIVLGQFDISIYRMYSFAAKTKNRTVMLTWVVFIDTGFNGAMFIQGLPHFNIKLRKKKLIGQNTAARFHINANLREKRFR